MTDHTDADTTLSTANVLPRLHLHGIERLRKRWGWFLVGGILLIIIGTAAVGMSLITTLTTMVVVGSLMVACGAIEVVLAFSVKEWGGFFLSLLVGLLTIVVGGMFIANPGATALALTLMIAMFLVFGGLFRIVFAIVERFPNRGWMLLHGVVNLLLGGLIWKQWPASGLWVIGLFVGIDIIFNGWTLVMLAIAARSLPSHESST